MKKKVQKRNEKNKRQSDSFLNVSNYEVFGRGKKHRYRDRMHLVITWHHVGAGAGAIIKVVRLEIRLHSC